MNSQIKELHSIYDKISNSIIDKLDEFDKIWNTQDNNIIFRELSFCILTPQSKATVCWNAISTLYNNKILFSGSAEKIKTYLTGVRFKNNKSKYIVEARNKFIKNSKLQIIAILNKNNNIYEKRNWLVKHIKGIGFKEASHFLRNIGFGENIAILDRHILRNLQRLGVIESIPKTITPTKYMEIENQMRQFSESIQIPLNHLDFVFWYKETNFIFK